MLVIPMHVPVFWLHSQLGLQCCFVGTLGHNPYHWLGAAIVFNRDSAWDDQWVGPFVRWRLSTTS
ncbi:unnamed protein product [Rhodiola kirilowii]